MTPLLIIKTANGFAVIEYTSELPQVDLRTLKCFSELEDTRSWERDGCLSAIKEHFKPIQETATIKEAA